MDTTLQEQSEPGYEDFLSWTDPPRKGTQFTFNDSLLFNSLEESARATAQAAISAFGVRFEPPAIAELYRIIEEGVIQMKLSKEEKKCWQKHFRIVLLNVCMLRQPLRGCQR